MITTPNTLPSTSPNDDSQALKRQRDAEFMHAVLCQLGLPRRPTNERSFMRSSGSASLRIDAGAWHDGLNWTEMPLPSGTRPRLVLGHICSEAVRTKSTEIEVENSLRGFLQRLGINTGGRDRQHFKRQMLALATCRMQLAYRTEHTVSNIKCDPIQKFEAWLSCDDNHRALWPGVITLSTEFAESLRQHAVPLDPNAIAGLQHSSLALDCYTWLAHRLCRIKKRNGLTLYWQSLTDQFGQEYRSKRDFKREFLKALHKALSVYHDAHVERVTGGIKLFPSAPPIARKQVSVKLPAPAVPATKRAPATSELSAPRSVQLDKLVSNRALEEVHKIAPGWCKYMLEADYKDFVAAKGEMPKYCDKAFLGWVRKRTGGKPP